jgi:hypothetical protein
MAFQFPHMIGECSPAVVVDDAKTDIRTQNSAEIQNFRSMPLSKLDSRRVEAIIGEHFTISNGYRAIDRVEIGGKPRLERQYILRVQHKRRS